MKDVFAEQGIPERVVSDNGGHYSSFAFRRFAEAWGFDHVTSSPHYPQSNGFIERQVQTIKNTLKKAVATKSDVQMALLVLRATPIDSHLPSPAELLNSRKFKTNLPIRIRNEHYKKEEIGRRLVERPEHQRRNHDRGCHTTLTPLSPGQDIRLRNMANGAWQPATVKTTCSEPRSYEVQTSTGNIVRRNRRDLRETIERHNPVDDSEDEVDNVTSGNATSENVTSDNTTSDNTTSDDLRGRQQETVAQSTVRPRKQVKFGTSTNYTSSGRRVKPPQRLDL